MLPRSPNNISDATVQSQLVSRNTKTSNGCFPAAASAEAETRSLAVDRRKGPEIIRVSQEHRAICMRSLVCFLLTTLSNLHYLPAPRVMLPAEDSSTRYSLAKSETGTYDYYLAGRPAGSESFTIETNEKGVSYRGNAQLRNGQFRIDQSVEVALDIDLHPVSFFDDARVNGQRTQVRVLFGDQGAQWKTGVEERTETHQVAWPKDQLLIADNVIHHLTLLARRYNTSKLGSQPYARTLSGAQPSLELLGKREITNNSTLQVFFAFKIQSGSQRLFAWTNGDNLVVKVLQPDQHFEAILRGSEVYTDRLTAPSEK